MNSPRYQKEGTDHDHERYVVDSGVQDARPLPHDDEMVKGTPFSQDKTKLVVMTLPMVLRDQRAERDRQQQDSERQHDEPARFHCGDTQRRKHVSLSHAGAVRQRNSPLSIVVIVSLRVNQKGRSPIETSQFGFLPEPRLILSRQTTRFVRRPHYRS